MNLPYTIKDFKFRVFITYLLGSLLTVTLALLNLFGTKGLTSLNLGKAIYFGEDSTLSLAIIKRISEGWIYNNPRLGYPFGSSIFDYPIPDTASLLFYKLLTLLSFDTTTVLNVYFFISFPLTFVITLAVLRRLQFSLYISSLVSFLFTLLPFHFERFEIGHVFYTWYFIIPIITLMASELAGVTPTKIFNINSRSGLIRLITASIVIGCFGVYYSFFGIILLLSAGIFSTKKLEYIKLKPTAIAISTVSLTVFLNLLPNILFKISNTSNSLVAARSPVESEVYGLKFIQFILPNYEHRIEYFRKIANSYGSSFPLINENMMSSLGILGSLGLIYLLYISWQLFAGNKGIANATRFFTFSFWTLFLFATIGGFGAVFAIVISPQIRGWNRIGIFISFLALLSFATLLNVIKERFRVSRYLTPIFAATLMVLGIADVMPKACQVCITGNANYSAMQSSFIKKIEASLPSHAAVYQYPYTQFPEVPKTNTMDSYSQLEGFIFSKKLRWSSGGMKGREGDSYHASLAAQSVDFQYPVLRELGFSAVYIDVRGYKDSGVRMIDEWSFTLKKKPDLIRADKQIYVFFFPRNQTAFRHPISVSKASKLTTFGVNGFTYPADFGSKLDFSKPGIPSYISEFTGLSNPEVWGRWSDARLSKDVQFVFAKPLPNQFKLLFRVFSYGPNIGKYLYIRSGKEVHKIQLRGDSQDYTILFKPDGTSRNRITFQVPSPISPSEVDGGSDNRLISVGFISLEIIPQN